MFQRHPLMQQADAAGAGGQGAAAGTTGAAAGAGAGAGSSAAGAVADKNGQQQQAGQQGKAQEGAASSQAGAQQDTTKGAQSTDAAKGAGAKAGDQAQIAIKLQPESKADPKFVEAYTAQAQKLGLSQEAAQGAWDFFSAAQAEGMKKLESATQQMVSKEIDAIRGDKQVGGANFDKAMKNRDDLLALGGEDFKKEALATGVISVTSPGFVKMLATLRASAAEDSIGDKGGRPPPAMTTRESELRQLFPNSYDQMVPKRA